MGRGGYTGDEGKDGFPAPTFYVGVLLAWIQGCILVPWCRPGVVWWGQEGLGFFEGEEGWS